MKRVTFNKIFGLSGLFLLASFAVAEGQQAKGFDTLDKNQDGVLSAAEASDNKNLSTQWTTIDSDGSGSIDRAEFSAFETEEIKEEESNKSMQNSDKKGAQY